VILACSSSIFSLAITAGPLSSIISLLSKNSLVCWVIILDITVFFPNSSGSGSLARRLLAIVRLPIVINNR